jgi:hypothetical protein
VGFSVANDMGWDVLREFWPEIAHKLKLPFRTHEEYDAGRSVPAAQVSLESAGEGSQSLR